jgi:SIR2-like domain
VSDIYSYGDYIADPFLATIALGQLLGSSSLRLFLGAGVSSGFGLPEWKMLTSRVLGKDTDTTFMANLDGESVEELRRLLDTVDDGSETYVCRVHDALYRDVASDLIRQLQKSPLLLAVAALMTGAHRGRVDSVVTYNYDDLLEQYLAMLGLSVCRRILPTDLSRRADVEINYVHGRLAQDPDASTTVPEIVLSEKSYRSRRAEITEGWSALVEHGLYSKIGLFVGLSGNDSAILDVLKRVQNRVRRTMDYNGYWLLTPDAFERNRDTILDVGMCPIRLLKEDIPQFVLTICQRAAN